MTEAPPRGQAVVAPPSTTFSASESRPPRALEQLPLWIGEIGCSCVAELAIGGPLYRDNGGWHRRGLNRRFSLTTVDRLRACGLVVQESARRLSVRLSPRGDELAQLIVDSRRLLTFSQPAAARPTLNEVLHELVDEERECLVDLDAGGDIRRDGAGWRGSRPPRQRFSLSAVARLNHLHLLEAASGPRLSLRLSAFGRQTAGEITKRRDRGTA